MYFYKPGNITPVSPIVMSNIKYALEILKKSSAVLPHNYASDITGLKFAVDDGMTLTNGVLGYTVFTSDTILLSPITVQDLEYRTNCESGMSIVVHELTHRKQMEWGCGVLWAFMNMAGVAQLTIEKWARENEKAALEALGTAFAELRNNT